MTDKPSFLFFLFGRANHKNNINMEAVLRAPPRDSYEAIGQFAKTNRQHRVWIPYWADLPQSQHLCTSMQVRRKHLQNDSSMCLPFLHPCDEINLYIGQTFEDWESYISNWSPSPFILVIFIYHHRQTHVQLVLKIGRLRKCSEEMVDLQMCYTKLLTPLIFTMPTISCHIVITSHKC